MDDDSSTDDGCPVGWPTKEQWEAEKKRKEKEEEEKKKKKRKKKNKKTQKKRRKGMKIEEAADTTTMSDDDDNRKMTVDEMKEHRQATQSTQTTVAAAADFLPTILVKSFFGKVTTIDTDPNIGLTVSAVKNEIIRTKFIREEHRGVVHFIDAQTRELMKDTDTIISDEGVYVLYVVLGGNPKHTGAIQRGDNDIYVPTCRNGFSTPDTSAAAASVDDSSTVDDSISVDDGVWEAKEFPSGLTVEGVYTRNEGYHEYDSSSFMVHEDHEVTYFQMFIVPPEIVISVGEINNGGSEFADLLWSVKIGESGSFDKALKKILRKRTFICFARQMIVMIFHRGNSYDIEGALHARFALKKGAAHGEFYCPSQLDIHDTIAHFEEFPDVKIVFCTTKFPDCKFGPPDFLPSESGYVYSYFYKWSEQQSRVIQELKTKHGNLTSTMPILDDIDCNVGDLCRALEAVKIGMHTCDQNENELRKYTLSACWANGITDQIACKSIYRDHPNIDERKLHNKHKEHHLEGEWFDGYVCPYPLEEVYRPLFDVAEPIVYSRTTEQPCKRFTKNAFRRYVELYGILTYKLVWVQIVSGAISIVGDHDPTPSELEKKVLDCMDPSDKMPLRKEEVRFIVKEDMFGDDYDSIDDTVADKAIDLALKKFRCIMVVLGNKNTFNAISEQAAIEIFTIIFGEDKRGMALEFSSHS
ncbi:hypothetical protein ACHAWC_006357 [Mediolabrus comicus]